MTLQDRVDSYSKHFPDRPPMHAHGRWIEGTWVGGNNYQGSGYFGAYPPDFLDRVWALFPDMKDVGRRHLHLFSGSLTKYNGKFRVDIQKTAETYPSIIANALSLPFVAQSFDFVLADTPYGAVHAAKYGTPMPDRRQVVAEAARITKPGGFMVWLDTKLPMWRKDTWHWCGSILVVRSSNHDFRGATIFERVAQ